MNDMQSTAPEMSAPVATSDDMSRQVATEDEYISIKEALEIFQAKGRAVTERTLQRYCEKLQLKGQKRITAEGEKWFVTRSSVLTRIKELEEFDKLRASRQAATRPDLSAPVGLESAPHLVEPSERQGATEPVVSAPVALDTSHATSPDLSRQAATSRDTSEGETPQPTTPAGLSDTERELYERMMTLLEERRVDLLKDKELLQADKEALLRQLEMKDKQIDRFFSSERDTKSLMARLQNMVHSIWPQLGSGKGEGDRYVPMAEALDASLPSEREERERQ